MHKLPARLRVLHEALTPQEERFLPPDFSPHYTPCVSSHHVFCGPDGNLIAIGMVRSDDTGTLGLRVVRERSDGGLDGLSHIAAQTSWAAFRRDGALPSDSVSHRPLISRGSQAISASYESRNTDSPIHSVHFSLSLELLEKGIGMGQLGLRLRHLIATDFLRVRYRGTMELNGDRLAIDSVGSLSLHVGDRLTQYGYLVTIPNTTKNRPPLLLVLAAQDEALHVLGEPVGPQCLVYGLGQNGLPSCALHIGLLGPDLLFGNVGQIALRDARSFGHDFLGQPTVSAVVRATLLFKHGATLSLGRAFFDARGARFVTLLHA